MIEPVNRTTSCAEWQREDGSDFLKTSGDWNRDGFLVSVTGTASVRFPLRYQATKLNTYESRLSLNRSY